MLDSTIAMEVSGKKSNLDVTCHGSNEDDKELYCDPCENEGERQPAKGFCVDCQEYLCSSCFTIHRRPSVWRHHVLLHKDAMPKTKTKEQLNYECTEPCAEHSTKIIEYYCQTHHQLGCPVCITGNHRTCNDVDYIPHIAERYKENSEINEIFDSLESLREETDEHIATANNDKLKVAVYEKNAKAQVLQLRDEFNSICDRLLEDIDTVKRSDESKIKNTIRKYEEISKKIKTRTAVMEKKLSEMKVSQLFTEAKLSKLSASELTKEVKLARENARIQHYEIVFNVEELREGLKLNFHNQIETDIRGLVCHSTLDYRSKLAGNSTRPDHKATAAEDELEVRRDSDISGMLGDMKLQSNHSANAAGQGKKINKRNVKASNIEGTAERECPPHLHYLDLWSPLNTKEKKKYDREFLLQFRNCADALRKPEHLPDIPDTILDKLTEDSSNGNPSDFKPRYVWTSTPAKKDLKFQPVLQDLNLQPNKAIPARGSIVTPKSIVEETAASPGTSTSAVFKFPTQTSVPLSTTKSDLRTRFSYISTSPMESRSEPFVHSTEYATHSGSFRQDATSRSSRLSAASNRFLSANDQRSSGSTPFVTASNSSTRQCSNMALTSKREQLDNTCITTSGSKFGQPVIMVASGPKTPSGFTSTPSFTSSTNNSTSQSFKFGSAPQSFMSASSTSAFKFSNDSSVTQKFKFDTNSSNSSSFFDAKLRSTADGIPSVPPLSSELDRSVSSVGIASLDTRSCSDSTFNNTDSTAVQGFKYDTASRLTKTSQFDTKVASTISTTSTWSSSFSTTATRAAISSMSQGPVFSSAVNARSASSLDYRPDLQLRTNSSTTQCFEFNFVTASSTFVLKNSESETIPCTIANSSQTMTSVTKSETTAPTVVCTPSFGKENLTCSVSPKSGSVHGNSTSESSPTASVFSLDSKLTSTSTPAGSANMYGITPDVTVPVTDMVASSDTNSSHSIDMPSFEDINSNASVPAMCLGQPFKQGYYPDVSGSETMTTEEFRSNLPTISRAVADITPVHAGDVTSKPQAMTVSGTEYRSPDQISPLAVGQGDTVVTRSPEKSPQRSPAFHTPQGSPAFHSQKANNVIDHASCLVSRINATKLDNHPEIVAELPAEPDMQTVKGRRKNEETARKNRIKRLPEVIGGQIGIDNTIPAVNAVPIANTVPTVNNVAVVAVDTSDVITIPEPMYPPELEHISENVMFKKVFCDIETTSLTMHTEIVQIAAVCEDDETFDQYILPMRQFDPGASKVTGLTCDGGDLYHHGIAVRTLHLNSALQRFLGWLDNLKPCVLVGHNFKNFDYPLIYRAFTKIKLLNAFHQIVLGFVDSYPLFKAIYPEEKSYKQESLVAKYVKETYDAHNALGDVKSLKKLFTVSDKITHEVLCMYSYTTNWYVDFHDYKSICNKNANTFKEIIDNKILSKSTVDKIAGSGLEMKHLKLIYNRDGPEALIYLLVSRASFSKATVGKLLKFLASV